MIVISTLAGQDGARYVYEISEDRATTLLPWDQRVEADPPLSLAAARKTAEAWLAARDPQIKAFDLSSLLLIRINPTSVAGGPCRLVGCWYYRIAFNPVVAGRALQGGSDFTVVVLSDGSIVEPRIEKQVVPASGVARGGPGRGAGVLGTGRATGPIDTGPIYRPGDGVVAPRVLQRVNTEYTDAALRAKVQGSVLLDAVINTDGSVGEIRVLRSLDSRFGLDEEAIKAARQWRFAPGTRMGVPVRVLVTLEMTFSLR